MLKINIQDIGNVHIFVQQTSLINSLILEEFRK